MPEHAYDIVTHDGRRLTASGSRIQADGGAVGVYTAAGEAVLLAPNASYAARRGDTAEATARTVTAAERAVLAQRLRSASMGDGGYWAMVDAVLAELGITVTD